MLSRQLSALVGLLATLFVAAFAYPADPPDTLTLTNGEILVGTFVRSTGTSVTFHSDSVGDVTISWSSVKALSSPRNFAVIPVGVQLKRQQVDDQIPRGTISVADQQIHVTPAGGQPARTVSTDDAAFVIDEDAYQKALHNPGIIEDWKGAVTGGVALVVATQKSQTYTSAVHLIRAIPVEDWLAARNRTLINFLSSYGKIEQPNTPEVRTNLVHFDAERDEYYSSRGYLLGQIAYDHNFSEGLTLQQTYGFGAGWTVIKTKKQTFDLKATGSYISQDFTDGTRKDLIGSVFGQTYHRDISAGVKFDEQITLIPSWNNLSSNSANGSAGITMVLRKRLSFNLSVLNTFLDDPPVGFNKNSFQFITGITYSLP